MNKLLLLAISLINFVLSGLAHDTGNLIIREPLNDSTLGKTVVRDPKKGFTNLFESASADGLTPAQLNPRAITFVQDYIVSHGANLNKMKVWAKGHFDMMDGVLSRAGLPVELKYLAVIESNLKSGATSWAGAVGPWQFMPATARLMGLKVTSAKDERRDYVRSTQAAAKYLDRLFDRYNDWLLVIAAYNGGPGRVDAAIRRSGSRDFWTLQYHLPAESRTHVKKFIATHYIMEGSGGLTTMTQNETEQAAQAVPELVSTAPVAGVESQTVSGKFNSIVIVQALGMDAAAFSRLNPGFDTALSAKGSYELKLPADKMLMFNASRPQILERSIALMLSTAGR